MDELAKLRTPVEQVEAACKVALKASGRPIADIRLAFVLLVAMKAMYCAEEEISGGLSAV